MNCGNYEYEYEFYVEEIKDYVTIQLDIYYEYEGYGYVGEYSSSPSMVDIGVITILCEEENSKHWKKEEKRLISEKEYEKFADKICEEIMEQNGTV